MRPRFVSLVLIGLLWALAPMAPAATIVELSGSGELELSASEGLYFDPSGLDLVDLTLDAPSIVVGLPLPEDLPVTGTFSASDATHLVGLHIEDDVLFRTFAWSGSVTLRAGTEIGVAGDLAVAGSLTFDSGAVTGFESEAGTGCTESGGVTVSAGTVESGSPLPLECDGDSGELTLGGTGIDISPIDVSPIEGSPAPEPGSAPLLVLGLGALGIAAGRRAGDRARRRTAHAVSGSIRSATHRN